MRYRLRKIVPYPLERILWLGYAIYLQPTERPTKYIGDFRYRFKQLINNANIEGAKLIKGTIIVEKFARTNFNEKYGISAKFLLPEKTQKIKTVPMEI